MKNKLSVVLPVAGYNLTWMERCLESTVGVADELIIVTDGCQHNSNWPYKVANEVLLKLPHSNIITMPMKGLAMALNVGIAAASHEWISFLCSDDWYDIAGMQKIKELAYAADNRTYVVGGMTHVTGHLGENTWPTNGDITRLNVECSITSPSLVRKCAWWMVEGYSDKRYLDWHYWNKMVDAGLITPQDGEGYEFHPIVMYHYHAWPGTISARYGYRADLGFEWGNGPKER